MDGSNNDAQVCVAAMNRTHFHFVFSAVFLIKIEIVNMTIILGIFSGEISFSSRFQRSDIVLKMLNCVHAFASMPSLVLQ